MLDQKLENYNIILASGSPRRQQFFRDLNLKFEIRVREVDEVYPDNLQSFEITDYLSVLKATVFENELLQNDILITSDTIVWFENKALGKPKNELEAQNILSNLSGKTHEVITSVCIKTNLKTTVFHDITKVSFHVLTTEMINYYIKKYKPFDKAGAYGVQEWIGFVGVSKIEGSYTNIMGLPVDKLFAILDNLE